MDDEAVVPSIRWVALDTALQRARDSLDQAANVLAAPFGRQASTPISREALAKALLKCRRRRTDLIRDVDFGEPAWDMLLELYVAEAGDRNLSVVDVCVASGVPMTTALRWIAKLETTGHIVRTPDPTDRRRYLLRIGHEAFDAIDQWLDGMMKLLS